MATVEITIDLDAKCKRCKKGGAAPSGYCLGCTAKMIKGGKFDHILKPMQDEVKKKLTD